MFTSGREKHVFMSRSNQNTHRVYFTTNIYTVREHVKNPFFFFFQIKAKGLFWDDDDNPSRLTMAVNEENFTDHKIVDENNNNFLQS